MGNRQAILIANSISYGVGSKNVSENIVKSIMGSFQSKLNSLGEHSFEVEVLIDNSVDDIRKKVLRKIRNCGLSDQMILFYYFGHAFRDNDGMLYLFCKDSIFPEDPTMLKMNDIVEWLKKYNVTETVMILDCCYGGAISKQFKIFENENKYYLMASVTPKDKALVDYKEKEPFGTFSKYIIDSFGNPKAADAPGKNVTFKSCFNFAKEMTEKRVQQSPISSDGGLAENIFFVQKSEPFIFNGFRKEVHKKTSYSKIYCLGDYLLNNEYKDITHFYNFLQRRAVIEFLTPIKNDNGDVSYEFVNMKTFSKYIILCEYLGIISVNGKITLTDTGKKMFRNDGKFFNKYLYEILKKIWNSVNMSIEELENAITSIIKNGDIPSSDMIWIDVYFKKKIEISKNLFSILLDLTSYVGALTYSNEKLFFISSNSYSASEIDF